MASERVEFISLSILNLAKEKITRALTPSCLPDKPLAITLSDRSEHACGALMYLRWNSDQGPIIRLVESKAKLSPLDHTDDAVSSRDMWGSVCLMPEEVL